MKSVGLENICDFIADFRGFRARESVDKSLGSRNPWFKAAACTKVDMSGRVKGTRNHVKSPRCSEDMQVSSPLLLPTSTFFTHCASHGGMPVPLLRTLTDS